MVLAPALDSALRRALRSRVAIAGAEFADCDAARARAFCVGGFVERDPSFEARAARGCAVRLCQGAQVPLVDTRTSPSNNRWRGP